MRPRPDDECRVALEDDVVVEECFVDILQERRPGVLELGQRSADFVAGSSALLGFLSSALFILVSSVAHFRSSIVAGSAQHGPRTTHLPSGYHAVPANGVRRGCGPAQIGGGIPSVLEI